MNKTLYFNGHVLTMDDSNTQAEALLTSGDTITQVGSEHQLRKLTDQYTQEVDLQGQTLIPAFIDPHGHFPDPGFIKLFRTDLSSPPRGDCQTLAQAMERLRAKAEETPAGEWIMGVLFDNTAIAEKRMPTRAELDDISTKHPIWVLHASGHNGVANSYTLNKQGIDKRAIDPPGGRYDRDPMTGELTGLIEGISAMGPLGDTDFMIDRERFWQGFYATRDEYLAHGVTYGQNAWASRDMLEHFASLPADQDPGFDLQILPIGELEPEISQGPNSLDWPGNPHFTLGARKLFSDGAFQLQTAYLSEPYHRISNPETPCGVTYNPPDMLFAEIEKLHSMGFQIHCHCNGDAGTELFLDAIEAAQNIHFRDDHRHTIIHGQVIRDDQLARMAELGVTVSFFSAHIHFWGDRHADTFLGPERAKRISPAGSAQRHNVRFTLHNDASVTPTRPIHLAHCAVNRLTSSGQLLDNDQKISVLSALRAQTIDAAWQVFQEDTRGSIEPGKMADFAILNHNPLYKTGDLLSCKVTATIRRGTVVYKGSTL